MPVKKKRLNCSQARAYVLGDHQLGSTMFRLHHSELRPADWSSDYVCKDPVISKRHVRFRVIVFDEKRSDGDRHVPPLVYADDLSRNGLHIEREREGDALFGMIPKSRVNGFVLLRTGDRLFLGSTRVTVQYFSVHDLPQSRLCPSPDFDVIDSSRAMDLQVIHCERLRAINSILTTCS